MKKKRSTLFKVSMIAVVTFIATLGVLISCEKQDIVLESEKEMQSVSTPPEILQEFPTIKICGTVVSKRIIVSEKKIVGSAFVFNDQKYLYVHAVALGVNKFHNAYLYAGTKDAVPMTPGNDPDYKAFGYKIENAGISASRTFKVPLHSLSGMFALSLMLETTPATDDGFTMVELHAWAEGKTIGSHSGQKGMIFYHRRGICLYQKPESLPAEIE
jgi:hypothetical protein